jgi:hypothetical protein
MDDWDLDLIAGRLQQAALAPNLWAEVLTDLSRRIGAKGAVLVSTDKKLPGVPMSPEVTPMLDDYFKNGWNQRDVRARLAVPIMLRKGVATDNLSRRNTSFTLLPGLGGTSRLPLFRGNRIERRPRLLVHIDTTNRPARTV